MNGCEKMLHKCGIEHEGKKKKAPGDKSWNSWNVYGNTLCDVHLCTKALVFQSFWNVVQNSSTLSPSLTLLPLHSFVPKTSPFVFKNVTCILHPKMYIFQCHNLVCDDYKIWMPSRAIWICQKPFHPMHQFSHLN